MMATGSIRIRALTGADVAAAAALDPVAWDAVRIADELEREHGIRLVAELEGTAVGYLLAAELADQWHILDLCTDPLRRRNGIASMLMQTFLEQAAGVSVTLEVRVSNFAAIALYERFGFAEVGRRPRYYRNPVEDAVLMTRTVRAPMHTAAGGEAAADR